MICIPLHSIRNEHLRRALPQSDGQVSLADVALWAREKLDACYEASPEPIWSIRIGPRTYDCVPLKLDDLIAAMVGVEAPIARQVAAKISAGDAGGATKYSVEHWYTNSAERRAALLSFWPDFEQEARKAEPITSEICNALLTQLVATIDRYASSAFRTLQAGTSIYRARVYDSPEFWTQLQEDLPTGLGAAPPEIARPNRLNPARVSCFYGSSDVATALSELRLEAGWLVVAGQFELLVDLLVLDLRELTSLKFPDDVFAPEYAQAVTAIGTLRGLPAEVSEPTWPGEKAEQYVAAQYFAEYLRRTCSGRVQGVVFQSTQRPAGTNYALFGGPELCGTMLRLVDAVSMRVDSLEVVASGIDMLLPGVRSF